MDLGLHGAISGFQKKIGTYDKANWEITVEKQEVQQLLNEKLSVAKLPHDLLDIDLIRGSTFTKAKPGYHWTQVTRSGFFKVVLFPLYYKWWRQQLPLSIWLFFMLLYFLQLISLVIYVRYQTHEEFSNISWPEAFVPLMAMVCLGEMYVHVVATNFTKPIGRKMKKTNKHKEGNEGRKSRRKSRDHRRRQSCVSNRLRSEDKADTSAERPSREESAERVIPINECEVLNNLEDEPTEVNVLRRRFNKNNLDEDSLLSESRYNEGKQSSGSLEEETTTGEETDDESTSPSSMSEPDEVEQANRLADDTETVNLLFPNSDGIIDVTQSNMLNQIRRSNDLISVSIYDGKSFKKAKLTFFEIGLSVMNKVESKRNRESDYLTFAIISSLVIGVLPLLFRIYQFYIKSEDLTIVEAFFLLVNKVQSVDGLTNIFHDLFGKSMKARLVIVVAMISRVSLSFCMFFLLCVAEAAYKGRYLYAKCFSALTSTRKSRRNWLPHFRLYKVKNIKAWLSLRSFLKKRGPQRSVDTIVSMAFMCGVLMIVLTCVQFITINGKDDKDHFLSYFFSWEVSAWSLVVGVFLIRFIALGSDINRKYRNNSILLTEQINLYLQMEKSNSKKEELLIANNVLKLAMKLLKELEGPYKVSGFIMNPLLSNIVRVVVLSLFSGVMSDILGFRLRLWKIKP